MAEASNEYKKITDKLNLEPMLEYSARTGGKFILIVIRMTLPVYCLERNFKTTEKKINLLCYAGTNANSIPEDWVIEYEMIKSLYENLRPGEWQQDF